MAEGTQFKQEQALAQKSKRRRTTPQDHAILEAAYLKNAKPDKIERAQIVSQVQLGEKEVQIWFQNRRQNDRRRSKPLQPHELIAHIANSAAPKVDVTPEPAKTRSPCHSTPSPSPASQAPAIESALNESKPRDHVPAGNSKPQQESAGAKEAASSGSPTGSSCGIVAIPSNPAAQRTPEPASQVSTASSSGSGRKRSLAEMMQQNVTATAQPSAANNLPPKFIEPLKRSSSVRLAMTADGAVKVRTNDEVTPSPEKERSLPAGLTEEGKRRRLCRSISMHDGLQRSSKAPKASGIFGRSRDHRKWEFYCDNSSDTALSIQAEAEECGSAVGAINLIRSSSVKGRAMAMSPAPSRANLQSVGPIMSTKLKLSRAKSSFAKFGTQSDLKISGAGKGSGHARSPSGDSDKENWAPGTRMSEHPLRRTGPSTNRRPILQDNEALMFPDGAVGKQGRAKAVMCKLSPTKEKARGEDLDCIQGLLSLSQGAWR